MQSRDSLFLVAGHTKNACDWMFNTLKMGYHCENIYTMSEEFMQRLHKPAKNVYATEVSCNNCFKDFDAYENMLYEKTLKGGMVKDSHVFRSSADHPGKIQVLAW